MQACTQSSGWHAELRLGFGRQGDRTVLTHRWHRGPLQVQRPFYPDPGGPCHVYVLHPPGGVVAGDTLAINVDVAPGAQALLTTPAAGKFYRSNGAQARVAQHLSVASGASLEWLPQESIMYDGARVDMQTHVELNADARFIGWEILCLGRRAAGETFQRGDCQQRFEIWREGDPLYLERNRIAGGDEILNAAWGLNGYSVMGTFVSVLQNPLMVEAIRAATHPFAADDLFSVTQLRDVLVCRYLGHSAERARAYFTHAWQQVGPALLQRPVHVPRVWFT